MRLLATVLVLLVLAAGAVFYLDWGTGPDPVSGDPGADIGRTTEDPLSDTQQGNIREMVEGRELVEDRERASGGPRIDLQGRLVYSSGAPAQGVQVSFGEGRAPRASMRPGRQWQTGAEPLRSETDEAGRFAFSVRSGKNGMLELPGGEVHLAEERFAAGMPVDVPDDPLDLGDIPVLAGVTLSGQVIAGGRGIEGVEIVTNRVASATTPVGMMMLRPANATTDDAGRFEVSGVRPGKVAVSTRSPEYVPATQEIELLEGQPRDVLIELQQGGVVTGTVIDDLGQPVEGARVNASRTREMAGGMQFSGFTGGESAMTDASGRFMLGGVTDESVQLMASKEGHAAAEYPDAKPGESGVVLRLARLASISGILVDEDDVPIVGSEVSANTISRRGMVFVDYRGGNRDVRTDEEGKFVLSGITPGENRVLAEGDDHLDATEEVEVRAGEATSGVRLVARRGASLTVTVLDLQGEPVVDAEVTASPQRSNRTTQAGNVRMVREYRSTASDVQVYTGGSGDLGTAKTDDRGIAVLKGLPPGPVEVKAAHEELALVEPGNAEIPSGGGVTAGLRMQRGGFVQITVVDQDGEPISGARFSVIGPIVDEERRATRASHQAGDDGSFEVGPLQPGSYKAVLSKGPVARNFGGGMAFMSVGEGQELESTAYPFSLAAGGATEVELVMPVLTTVRGTVHDAQGLAVGVDVDLFAEGDVRIPMFGQHRTQTDENGQFAIEGMDAGTYTLSYGRSGALVPAEKEVILAPNQEFYDETLMLPGAVIAMLVRDDQGDPVAGAKAGLRKYQPPAPPGQAQGYRRTNAVAIEMISTEGGPGMSRMSMTSGANAQTSDAEGKLEIEGVPEGKYTLTLEHGDFAKITKVLEIFGDRVEDLGVLTMSAGCTIKGTVSLPEGSVRVAEVELTDANREERREMAMQGHFTFASLPAGTYTIRARSVMDQAWGPAKTVEAKVGETEEVELDTGN